MSGDCKMRLRSIKRNPPNIEFSKHNIKKIYILFQPHGPNITDSKTIDIGGMKKQVVTQQFNSPLGLYSDETIADTVVTNRHGGAGGAAAPKY